MSADRTTDHSARDFAWAVPIMRAGYAGRGLVYLLVAGLSLWSILNGGEAEGTAETMQRFRSGWGIAVLLVIALAMLAYAIWRAVDGIWDLEDYGSDLKGVVARAGMIITGLVHLGLAALAIIVAVGVSRGGGDTGVVQQLFASPMGQLAAGIIGVITIAVGFYYLHKAWTQGYLDHLQGNPVTRHLNMALRIGLAGQGVAVGIIGLLIVQAATYSSRSEAGGLGSAFDWLQSKAYGQALVIALCLGLLGFGLFCFVNARYRIVPRADASGTPSLRQLLNG
ncbi:DUF1206 domain-containing protein [Phaeobacter sp. JH18-32]|uniref:DUF1206 domain-containing protein n=1 Tax=Phaeobacter TaxID=302485 RepID=UPI0030C9FED9